MFFKHVIFAPSGVFSMSARVVTWLFIASELPTESLTNPTTSREPDHRLSPPTGDREITVKDNQNNVIAAPRGPESSESPAPVVELSHGPQPFRPLDDQSLLRRLEVPQSMSGS